MRTLLALTAVCALSACAGAPAGAPARPAARVMTGLDVLESQGFAPLKGKRVGVITNRTGVDAQGRPILDLLAAASGVTVAAVFTPEHGFGAVAESDKIASSKIRVGGREVPLYSLYSGGAAGMRPQPAQLAGLDALVFDIQDAGARFYTYPATMAMALEAAKAAGLTFFVLDRPNPVGGSIIEGPRTNDVSLIGSEPTSYLPVVTRHGMTVGELARLHNAKLKYPGLTVVKMRGWKRSMWYDDTGLPWIPPSPNLPDLSAATLYPGIANLELTNLSVGRGTDSPFGWIGAPWLDAERIAKVMNKAQLEGVKFSAETRTPSKDKYAGQAIPGVRITVTDRAAARPLKVFARLAAALHYRHAKDFDLRWAASRKLIGRVEFKDLYDSGADSDQIESLFDLDSAEFEKTRAPYLLYKDKDE